MRTVFYYLGDAEAAEVSAFLARELPRQVGPPWVVTVDGDACLYVNLVPDLDEDASPEELDELRGHFGGRLPCTVSADVSGRHKGNREVRALAELLLGRFGGLASDDFSEHMWTLEEIRAVTVVDGRAFFEHTPRSLR